MGINNIPVIAIDGPSASGKGTVAQQVSRNLGFHYLDSGTLYRLIALVATQRGVNLADEEALANIAKQLRVTFKDKEIRLGGEDVADLIRTEACGNGASRVAAHFQVRKALLGRQRAFRLDPGLVAEGRDMCSVVFPDATLKIFLAASAETRAQRRYKQLMEKGADVNIATILQDIRERDARDSDRSVAPLKQSANSSFIDTTLLNITEVVNEIQRQYTEICVKNV
ncbi:MAG: (d)CMP kinase [Nitrosomonadales bacterium]|nr:MAG: (d)CMP kinase [Nitrosomonadales bacterium]